MKEIMLKGLLNSISLIIFILISIMICMYTEQFVPMIAFSLSLVVIVSDALTFFELYRKEGK